MVLPYEPGKTPTPASTGKHVTNRRAQLAQYEIDRRSAYIGNLPLDMTEEELREMSISCGQVAQVTLNHKSILGGACE